MTPTEYVTISVALLKLMSIFIGLLGGGIVGFMLGYSFGKKHSNDAL